jgi:hypothetical protein
MATKNRAKLRIEAEGGVPVSSARELLASVEHAYNGLLILESMTEPRSVSNPSWIPSVDFSVEASSGMVLPTDRLVLSAVELSSPGFFEFLGSLNPLEVIRKYLVDRHERRKDREYKEGLEAQRLSLENQRLANGVIAERIDILKKLGVPDPVIASIVNHLVYRPLEDLGGIQDRGLIIEAGEIRESDRHLAA